MKKMIWIVVILTFTFTLITLWSCNKNTSIHNMYSANREWKFSVKRTNSQLIDTIILKVADKPQFKGEKAFKWILITSDSTASKIIDSSRATISENVDGDTYISLPMPSNRYFKFISEIPTPSVRLPLYVGYSENTEITIEDEELKGKTITGKIEVVGKIYYDNPLIRDSCWVLNAIGNSAFGKLKAKYYFHEKSGFVYFYYDFIKYQIEMVLISLK